ncbi:MAG: hypothetical protein U0528_00725 [Anaerolineae bacterium]
MLWKSLRASLTSLILGWAVALLIGACWALLQYQEVSRSFAANQIAAEFQSRIDRELWRGSLLLYVQVGVLCAALWWRVVAIQANGLLTGAITAGAQALFAVALGSSLLFWIPLVLLITAVGVIAERWRISSAARPSLGTSSAEHPRH